MRNRESETWKQLVHAIVDTAGTPSTKFNELTRITNRYQLSKHAIFLKIDWNVTDIVTVIFLRSICRHFFYALLFQVFCSFIYLVAARVRFHWDEATKCHILARQECSMFSNTNAKCHLSLVLVISLVRKKAVVYVIGYIMKQDARYARGFPPSID